MKHIKLFEELTNLSKTRKWPTHEETSGRNSRGDNSSDMYFSYDLPKQDIGKYLNTWFEGEYHVAKNGVGIRDERITLVKVDDDTAYSLYGKDVNPISISRMPSYRTKTKGNHDMKAQIHSIDDSSFGIWWMDKTLDELDEIRTILMSWISSKKIINGEEFLDYCVSIGADNSQRDYN